MNRSFFKSASAALFLANGLLSNIALADEPTKAPAADNLQGELKSLESGDFNATPNEKLFVVQDRHNDLTNKWQMTLGAGMNLNPNIYVNTNETSLAVRYYINNIFFAQVDGAKVNNKLTTSGERIYRNDGIYPDTSFVKQRVGGSMGANLMYGKIRVTQNFVFYFDQYLALGGGQIEQSNGMETTKSPVMTGEIGLSMSTNRYLSVLLSVKDNYFEEKRRSSVSKVHQMMASAGLGVALGGKAL